jgi:DUF1365 family protein
MMTACSLVQSQIIHIRHGEPSHRLERKGLSIWIDLDHLDQADRQSLFFSVGRLNLMSFHETDHGWNFKSKENPRPLAEYARGMAKKVLPNKPIDHVRLLTFPRILGMSFNPISVYLCSSAGQDVLVIYEVRNTFGDMHSYVGVLEEGQSVSHEVKKHLHVSPFFSMEGGYRLRIKASAGLMRLLIRYTHGRDLRLTATLRGDITSLTTSSLWSGLLTTGQLPMRPWMAIHWEAVKLWFKKVQFFKRPEPQPKSWTLAKVRENKSS